MKTRLASTLVLLPLIALTFASSSAAQKPIPNISKTAQFKSLKSYVNVLRTKVSVPVTDARKREFTARLSERRLGANTKAKALYAQRINRIAKQDDRKERRQIKMIRHTQKEKVSSLNRDLASRSASLRAKETAAIARVDSSYSSRINSLSNKRSILQRRLVKTNKPAKRQRILAKIRSVQKQLNGLVDARQADINSVAARYDGRQANLNDLFGAKISRAKASAQRQVKAAKNAYKRLFREQIATAKERRSSDLELITTVRDRGADYIRRMPVA